MYICFLQSLRESFMYYPLNVDKTTGVYAVRHKEYKAHYYTEG